MTKVHFGCSKKYPGIIDGWDNLDIFPEHQDIKKCDVLSGLPYKNESVDAIFSCHTFEHFTLEEAQKVIKDCFRILKKNGVIRIVVPDLQDIIDVFYDYRLINKFFPFQPKLHKTPSDFLLSCLLQKGQHKYMYTEKTLKELFSVGGFNKQIKTDHINKNSSFEIFKNIIDFPNRSLAIESKK